MKLTCCFVLFLLPGCQALENRRPAFFPIGNQEVLTGDTLRLQVSAIDDDHDPLSFDILNKPAGAVFRDLQNGQASFLWTPIASDAGADGGHRDHLVSFLVSDGIDFATETILISVKPGNAGSGSPVFICAVDHTLDLFESNHVRFRIEVRDADSAGVDLEMLDTMEGALFESTPGDKLAWFEWAPTEEQLERPVWSFRVSASDRVNPPVIQLFTILIQNRPGSCPGTPPTLQHQPLADQNGPDDYPLWVQASDRESRVTAVTAYYRLVDDAESPDGAMAKLPLEPDGAGGWQGHIPNPGLTGDQSRTMVYTLCALDDDDQHGDHCDQQRCIPEDSRYTFQVHPPQQETCQDDDLEDNDTSQTATLLAPGTYPSLRSCEEPDWYWFDLRQGDTLEVLINFDGSQANLDLYLFDYNGSRDGPHSCEAALACATTPTDNEYLRFDGVPYDGPYFLLVHPAAGTPADYHLTASVVPGL